ncbi:PP2C family serine/threonine-protein phosphatase [Nocardioides sp.]|uniref:PP2C family protein-serine/threonine phosphatase n=1 Tax=Nocardioides sp. TaxID=35761 RepID=UPI00356A260E
MRLDYSAISDVGRVRKDNQDSGYAGPHLLAVCDGVGGAARGDIASATTIHQLRSLDEEPPSPDLDRQAMLDRISGSLEEAHNKIAELVDEDPGLEGTSTTATVAMFDGTRVAIGHIGDSRAYLFRDGELSQLTSDHTFVQGLVDEGRITEAEARVHPHRNLILRAVDGRHEIEPDLFVLDLNPGDRLLLCSDGACGVLEDGRLADILSSGSPDYAAVEMVRASLEAGSSDNVTCLVAEVKPDDAQVEHDSPLLVGAAAELRRKGRGVKGASVRTSTSLFRGHRAGDTGELEPISAEILDEVPFAIQADPEVVRYAPLPPARHQWVTRVLALMIVGGLAWAMGAAAWSWVNDQYYVGEDDGVVVIYRGLNASLPGIDLSQPYESTNVDLSRLSDFDARQVSDGIDAGSLDDARETVDTLAAKMTPEDDG